MKRRVCPGGPRPELRTGSRQGGEHSSSGSNLAVRRGEPSPLHHSGPPGCGKAQTLGPLERRLTFSLTKLCWPPLTLCPRSAVSCSPSPSFCASVCVCGPVCVLRLFASHPRSSLSLCVSASQAPFCAMTVCVHVFLSGFLFLLFSLVLLCLSASLSSSVPLGFVSLPASLSLFLSILCLWPTLYPSTHTHMHTSLSVSLCLGSPAQPLTLKVVFHSLR